MPASYIQSAFDWFLLGRACPVARPRALDVGLLESRILLNAAPAAALAVAAVDAAVHADSSLATVSINQFVPTADGDSESTEFRFAESTSPSSQVASPRPEQSKRREVAFVDSAAADSQQLVDDLAAAKDDSRDLDVYVLDPTRDGILQISEILAGYSDLDAIHLVSHGTDGKIQLGTTWLSNDNLSSYAGELAGWKNALHNSGSDLLIYGCDVAANETGRTLIESLAALTGADVAASTNDTGNQTLGGDWDLEFCVGQIEAVAPISQQEAKQWLGLLNAAPVGTEFQVNTTTQNDQQTVAETRQAVAMNQTTGDYVVVWSSKHSSSGNWDVLFQRFNSAGVAQGSETLAAMHVAGVDRRNASVAINSSGNFVVTWSSNENGHLDIYAQRFNASGVAQGAAILVDTPASKDQDYSTVAINSSGAFVVTWSGQQTGKWQVYANVFNSSGVSQTGPIQVTNASQVQQYSYVALSDAGNFVLTWSSHDSHWNVNARLFASNNQPLGAAFQVNTNTSDHQQHSAVALDANSNFTITWSGHQNGHWNIYAQSYLSSGATNGSNFRVDTSTSNDQDYSSIAFAGSGNPVITWSSKDQDGNGWGVYAQQLTPTGTLLGSEFQVNITTDKDQFYSSVAGANNGNAVIVWTSDKQDGDNFGVFGRRISGLVNIAPSLIGANNLVAISEDPTTNPGTLVSSLIAGKVTDPDSGALAGIAVTAVDNTNGNWQYSTNGGSAWISFGSPSIGTALLLAADANTYVRFIPNVNWNGTVAGGITFKAWDRTSGTAGSAVNVSTNGGSTAFSSGTASASITANPVNDAPVAVNNTHSVNEDNTLTVAATGVLANDSDIDGNPLTAVLVTGPANAASFTLNADGSFSYTPTANFSGTNTFTYRASDGSLGSNIATVTITVNPVNDAPIAVGDTYNLNEDSTLTVNAAAGVRANDSDVEGSPLAVSLATGTSSGALMLNADGSFTYTPNANFNGTDSFTYRTNDGALNSNVVTVTINVNPINDAPVAVNDSYSPVQNTPLILNGSGILANDTDLEGNPLTAFLFSGPSNGMLTLNPNGSLTYTPNLNYSGPDSFTYRINDGTVFSNIATVNLSIVAVPSSPVANNDAFNVNENTTLNLAGPGVLSNDVDPQGLPLVATVTTLPSNGLLVLNADGSFSYIPSINFNGTDSFGYRAGNGLLFSNVALVTITVNPVNTAPLAADDSGYSMDEDSLLIIAAPGVLANDSDVDGNPLSALLVAGPSNGLLALSTDGRFSYAPNADFSGSDSFTYRANDGLSDSNVVTVSITVNAINDAPIASNDAVSVNEDAILTVGANGVLANDTDADGNPLTATLVTNVANGLLTLNADGSFTYDPNANFNGTDTFSYTVNDGAVDSAVATVTITVNAINNAPVAMDDAYSVDEGDTLSIPAPGILTNDSDVDGNPLTSILVSGTASGSLVFNVDGSFTYTPHPNFNGTDSFTYRVSDGTTLSNLSTVTITVLSVNNIPITSNDNYSIEENGVLNVAAAGVLGNDTDIDGDPLTAALVSGPSNGVLVLNADGSFTYTPNLSFNGIDTFTYRVSDGQGGFAAGTVQITVHTTLAPPQPPANPQPPTPPNPPPQNDSTDDDSQPPFAWLSPFQPTPDGDADSVGRRPVENRVSTPPNSEPQAEVVASAIITEDPSFFDSLAENSVRRLTRGAMAAGAAIEDQLLASFDVGLLWNDLANLKDELRSKALMPYLAAGSVVGLTSGLSVGYVFWAIRSGWLVTGLLAQMPAWRLVDPLVVLDYLDDESSSSGRGRKDDDDSLESLLDENTDGTRFCPEEQEATDAIKPDMTKAVR